MRFSNFKPWILVLLPFFLFGTPAHAQFSDTHDLLEAVEDNDFVKAREMIFKGANVNARRGGRPAIMMAVDNNLNAMLKFLLENGAIVDATSFAENETALMLASAKGNREAVQILLEFGADPNRADKSGQNALMKAAQARQSKIVEILIEAGADVYQTDYSGRTAMQYAREARARKVVRMLEDAGASY